MFLSFLSRSVSPLWEVIKPLKLGHTGHFELAFRKVSKCNFRCSLMILCWSDLNGRDLVLFQRVSLRKNTEMCCYLSLHLYSLLMTNIITFAERPDLKHTPWNYAVIYFFSSQYVWAISHQDVGGISAKLQGFNSVLLKILAAHPLQLKTEKMVHPHGVGKKGYYCESFHWEQRHNGAHLRSIALSLSTVTVTSGLITLWTNCVYAPQ